VSAPPKKVTPAGLRVPTEVVNEANDYIGASRSANTRRAYASDWRHFTSWCEAHGRTALPADPETVVFYLTMATRTDRSSTLRRRLSTISVAHRAAGFASPTEDLRVKATWGGIRRTHGTAERAKDAALTEDVRAMVATLEDNLSGRRDACLLLVGFASALRRSELVALDVGDVAETADGLVLTVRRSKTDQEGEGRQIGLLFGSNRSTCPVRAYRAWLEASWVADGPVFRPINRHGHLGAGRLSAQAVALVVKRSARAAGLDSTKYAGHSLRSGMATSAARGGASEAEIMRQTGHRSLTVVRRYIRAGTIWEQNASAKLGL
jgi:site-specific recombinase XerD